MRVMVLVVVLVVVLLMLMLMLVVVVVRMRVLLRSWPNSSNAVPPVEHNTLQPIDLINCPPIVWTAQRQRIPPKGQQQLIELVEREKGKRQSRRGVKPQIIKAKGKRKREREKCAKSGRRHKRWRGTLLLAGTRQRQSLVAGRQAVSINYELHWTTVPPICHAKFQRLPKLSSFLFLNSSWLHLHLSTSTPPPPHRHRHYCAGCSSHWRFLFMIIPFLPLCLSLLLLLFCPLFVVVRDGAASGRDQSWLPSSPSALWALSE